MCGICGFVSLTREDEGAETTLMRMAGAIKHRGPDSNGTWHSLDGFAHLGHTRLAINDLSPTGAQPMSSICGRFSLVFNGEIYNHHDLRRRLIANRIRLRGRSDTEVLLETIANVGLPAALKEAVGMFSLALWDNRSRSLFLARDRLGEKPLYYSLRRGIFAFGSELKAVRSHPNWADCTINRDALPLYLRHGYIPGVDSIYEGVNKLQAGTILRHQALANELEHSTPYWQIPAKSALTEIDSDKQAIDALENKLSHAVKLQMEADVPLGAFLSGGVDSSLVVALMQRQSQAKVKTFTIGFRERGFDEAPYARAVAEHIGTDHHEFYVTPEDALRVVPSLPHVYCEPFADSSQIPTILVSQLARRHVTVSLSGDGGDELFLGYERYRHIEKTWKIASALPSPARRLIGASATAIGPNAWENIAGWWVPFLFGREWQGQTGDRIHRTAALMNARSLASHYRNSVSTFKNPEAALVTTNSYIPPLWSTPRPPGLTDREYFGLLDAQTYLPDDILVKLDRASMSVGLEGRIPLLDHRVFEFALNLPSHFKVRDGQEKWILRQLLYRYVPKALIDRPKRGFGVPIGTWLKGPLREWAEDLLDYRRLNNAGYFQPKIVKQLWDEHQSGKRNCSSKLWFILMFQAWLRENAEPNS